MSKSILYALLLYLQFFFLGVNLAVLIMLPMFMIPLN